MLTIIEQLKVLQGEVKQPSKILLDLVFQSAMKYARDFSKDYKVFETLDISDPANPKPLNTEAASYVRKHQTLSNSIFLKDQRIAGALHTLIISIMGDTSIVFDDIQTLTDPDWEAKIKEHLPTAFELFAGITKDEKDKYDKV